MRYDEATVGVITLSKLGLDQFDDDDLRLLTILADQAATAVESARLLTRSQDLAGELRRLLDMSAELSESLDPRQVADLMARHLARGDGRRGVRDQLLGPARLGRLDSLGYYPAASGSTRWRRTSTWRAIRRRCASSSRRWPSSSMPRIRADPAEEAILLVEAGNRMVAMLPLVAKGQAIGLVELFSKSVVALGRGPPRAGPDDGQRGRDGPRERAPLRGRPQAAPTATR